MKNLKKSILILLSSIMTLSLGVFAACDLDVGGTKDSTGNAHEHEYATTWTTDETHHWHAATCEHESRTSDRGKHKWNEEKTTCTVCGYIVETENVQRDTYNVVFNYNYEGVTPDRMTVNNGAKAEKPGNPTRDNFAFKGWYTDSACTKLYDFNMEVTKNIVLFAGWSSDLITISFNYNYIGAPAVVTQTISNGSKLEQPEEPLRTNYAFAGWFTDAATSPEKAFDFDQAVSDSLTLYAKWTLTDAVIKYDVNCDDAEPIADVMVKVNTAATAPAEPTREAYDFTGWYTAAEGGDKYDFATLVTKDMTLYAGWKIKTYTVTFDWNGYDSGTPASATVQHGDVVEEPTSNRTGYVCVWKLNGEDYSFSTPITGDITLKANWVAESSDSFTATFYYNYDGAPNGGVYEAQTVKKNRKPEQPALPQREGHMFEGWYADAECTTKYDFDTRLQNSVEIYAKWLKKHTFEAEYVDLDGKVGFGFSANLEGTDLIYKDPGETNASNGYYVSGLYYQDAFIEFKINSDKEVFDAVVIIRVQVEFDDKTFNPDLYEISVNGVGLDYEEFFIEADESDSREADRRPFIDVQMAVPAHLVKGENIIRMTTKNNIKHGNTRNGDAPMIDCIYVYTDANLTWNPKESNLEGKE